LDSLLCGSEVKAEFGRIEHMTTPKKSEEYGDWDNASPEFPAALLQEDQHPFEDPL
jgi:hypothetical protein